MLVVAALVAPLVASGEIFSSCNEVKKANPNAKSGTYSIRPSGYMAGVDVFCEMEKAGGGWTLCGKFLETGEPDQAFLRDPFGRAAVNEGDLASIGQFTGR